SRVQHADDRNAVRARKIEDDKGLETFHAPLAHLRELWIAQSQTDADLPVLGQIDKRLLGLREKALGGVFISVPVQIDVVLYQIRWGCCPPINSPHYFRFCLAATRARASLRIADQSSRVNSASSPRSPSSSKDSRRSSALRFSSSRMSSRMYSLALL